MENKKQYITITPFFPSDNNHVGSYIYDQVKEIQNSSNYQIGIIKVVGINSLEKDYIYNGFQVYIFKVIDFPFFIFPGLFDAINSKRIRSFVQLKFNTTNLSIVHGHVSYPSAYLVNALSESFDVKTIIQHHGIDALQLLNGKFSLLTRLQKPYLIRKSIRQLNKIDLNVFVSKRVQLELLKYKDYNPVNEYILYNGVDRSKFYPIEKQKNEKFEIGCVANFWPIKDHISLVKAVEYLVKDGYNDILLRLIGSGETFKYCKSYVLESNLDKYVQFEKERNHIELNRFYNEIDVFVLPSYYEALGCVLLESWATNTPVISIKKQGIEEVLPFEELNNLLAEKKNPESLKEKILGEYKKKRKLIFNEKYDIKSTINDFLNQPIFKDE